jgi:xanthine dehydrogenase accessory factor
MLDLLPSLGGWRPAALGARCAVATIVGTEGSAPRPLGTSMLVSESADVLGSLSGGCIEGAVVESALDALRDGAPRLELFGYSAEDAFVAGLSCGGELEVHIQPLDGSGLDLAGLGRLSSQGPAGTVALIRRIGGGGGAVVVAEPASFLASQSAPLAVLLGLRLPEDGEAMLAAAAQLEPLLRGGRTGLVRLAPARGCSPELEVPEGPGAAAGTPAPEPVTLLVESRLPPARMLVFGANDFGAALVPAARLLGYHVTVCDARPAFAGQDRFGAADDVAVDWPHRYLEAEVAAGRLDGRTAVCVLTHDPKFDVPLLQAVLRLDLGYVGALGSRRSHEQRMASLRRAGVAEDALIRLHSPIGLDLGAVTPAEVAVSITAELVAVRNRRDGATGDIRPLKNCNGPIHRRSSPESPAGKEPGWT